MLKKVSVCAQLGVDVLELVLGSGNLVHRINSCSTRTTATGSDICEDVSSWRVDISDNFTSSIFGKPLLNFTSSAEDVQLGRSGHSDVDSGHVNKNKRSPMWHYEGT